MDRKYGDYNVNNDADLGKKKGAVVKRQKSLPIK